MRPALAAGDVIVYRRGVAPSVGELAVFEHDGSLVVHRMTAQYKDGSIATRGDANHFGDRSPVPPEAVRGTVVLAVPAGRLVANLADVRR
jgi:signal peptidase I